MRLIKHSYALVNAMLFDLKFKLFISIKSSVQIITNRPLSAKGSKE